MDFELSNPIDSTNLTPTLPTQTPQTLKEIRLGCT